MCSTRTLACVQMCIRDRAQREYDLNKAAELKYGKLPQLQKQLEEEEKIAAAKKEDSLLRDVYKRQIMSRFKKGETAVATVSGISFARLLGVTSPNPSLIYAKAPTYTPSATLAFGDTKASGSMPVFLLSLIHISSLVQ